MYKRILLENIRYGLEINSSVALLGPREVGKTTLANMIAKDVKSVYLDLENYEDLQKISAPEVYMDMHSDKLIILDEIQRYPDLFMSLRGIIDKRRQENNGKGNFLLLGSASNELLKQSSESLAGRISYLELSGLSPIEVNAKNQRDVNKLWLRGGFPDSFSASNDLESGVLRKDFIRTYIERDIPTIGPRIPATTLMRFWTMLAHNQGELFNASKIASSLDVTSSTVSRYLDLMTDLFLVRKLMPWHGNVKKRMIKTLKTYIRDSGIVHALLNINGYEELMSHPVFGKSWEGFVIENILAYLPHNILAFFYRTRAGAEIDLLLEVEYGKYWAIEIKSSNSPTLTKGFYNACEDLKPIKKFVIYTGADTYPMKDDIMVMPLIDFLKLLAKNL